MRRILLRILTQQYIRSLLTSFLVLLFLIPFSLFLYTLYVPHINSFGCFDECMNYVAGYFLLQGKTLYTQIFFNHQPILAYISFLVLKIGHPANLFEMLLRYKQTVLLIGFISNFFIIRRFKWVGIGFVVIFELTKYYLFADKFLAESIMVYPAVYLTSLVWYKLQNQKIYTIEYFACALFSWVIIFSREPFIPLGVVFLVACIGWPSTYIKKLAYGVFIVLTAWILISLPLREYIYQVFILNSQGVGSADASSTHLFGSGILQVFLYPMTIFFDGVWNEFRIVLIGLSLVFCWFVLNSFFRKQNRKLIICTFLLLGLANIRPVPPGEVFYGAFHMIIWFGMFVLLTLMIIKKVASYSRVYAYGLFLIVGMAFVGYIFFSKSFLHMHVDMQTEFSINFGETYQLGQVVHIASKPGQTFFIDHDDSVDASYIQSERLSPYKYSDYGFIAPSYPLFQNAYITMFEKDPPDIYYGKTLPKQFLHMYVQLVQYGQPSRLYIKKNRYQELTPDIWRKIQQFGYEKII